MIIFLRKAYSFLKSYWWIPAILVVAVVATFIMRRVPTSLMQLVSKQRELHKKEVEAIEKVHTEEIKQREEALDTYHKTVKAIEEKYEKESLELTKKKKKEIKKIVDETHSDPDLLAKKLADQMGFVVVQPEEQGK